MQEVLANQLDDLVQLLGNDYEHVGVGRDDGVRQGEFAPIFVLRYGRCGMHNVEPVFPDGDSLRRVGLAVAHLAGADLRFSILRPFGCRRFGAKPCRFGCILA